MGKYTYLLLLVFSLAYPLAQSFEWRLQLWKRWRYLFPAIILNATIFLLWDVYFAYHNVWAFNPEYVIGIWLYKLPLEEWLFFVVVPYACFFIYAVLNYYVKKIYEFSWFFAIHSIITLLLLLTGIYFIERIYTSVAFLLAAIVLFIVGRHPLFRLKIRRFYSAYLVSLIPFLVINGVLTAMPVVTYNDSENLGIRIYTIPLEDSIYLLSLLFLNFGLTEYFIHRWKKD
jgi:lycopene cyclase domain-containing protein